MSKEIGSDSQPTFGKNFQTILSSLSSSLKKANLSSKSGPYDIVITKIHEVPVNFGTDMQVTTKVNYQVIERKNSNLIHEETVETVFVATMSDSLIGAIRSAIAVHGAWRTNIGSLVERLSHSYD